MTAIDPAGEWLRISAHYRQLSDSELLVLGRQQSELTDFAQQALAHELSQRGLKVESVVEKKERPAIPEAPLNPSYEEDRRLIPLCKVWSVRDALQVQMLLDHAGIPFVMGTEEATDVDAVTSGYGNGVPVLIMSIGYPWAARAMKNYFPADEPPKEPRQEPAEIQVRCPKCHSEDVVFERLILSPEPEHPDLVDPKIEDSATRNWPASDASPDQIAAPIYKWTCDACGHQWEDDGVLEEE